MRFFSTLCRAASSLIALACLAALYSGAEAVAQFSQDSSAAPAIVRLYGDGTIELNGAPSGSLSDLSQVKAGVVRFFAERRKAKGMRIDPEDLRNPCGDKPVVIQADASLKYGMVVDLILAVRAAYANPLKVEASDDPNDPYAMTPAEPCLQRAADIKPNPLTLVVAVTSERKLVLNGDEMGTTDDTSRLAQKLTDIFQTRAEMRAYRPGTDKVEKTTYIRAARSLSFGEVKQVMDAVKQAGADPTGLQVDDLPNLIVR
ncbi:MAG TPA: biopolymer transporter ExbD [Pyrinomonadaceae bacterium]|jgi:biopolymer transport protein ExbD